MASFSEADNSSRIIHLAFHKILNRLTYSSTNFAPRRFFRLLDLLAEEGCFSRGRFPASRVELTFDDGYEHLADIIPVVIEKYNLKPIIFIPTAWIGKSNRWDYSRSLLAVDHLRVKSIKRLADCGAVIASHGHSHRSLTEMGLDQIMAELNQSRKILEDITGERVTSVSYPFGRCNGKVMQIAHECGYECGYTMRFPEENDSRLAVGRIGVWTFDTPFSVLGKINVGPMRIVERMKAALTNRLSLGTTLLNRIRSRRV